MDEIIPFLSVVERGEMWMFILAYPRVPSEDKTITAYELSQISFSYVKVCKKS